MSNHWFLHAKQRLGRGQLDLASADLRVALIMSGNSVATQEASRLSGFTALAELNSTAGYLRKQIASAALTEDTTYKVSRFTFGNLTWTGLTSGTTTIAGALLYHHLSASDADNVPVAWYDDGMPQSPTGEDFFFQNSTRGALLI